MEADGINVKKYVEELAVVTTDLTKACGRVFEHGHLRFTAIFSGTRTRGGGGGGGGFHRGVMEHKVITNLRAVRGDKSLSRQVGGAHEEIVYRLFKEIDSGKEMEKVVTGFRGRFGDQFDKVPGDV